MFVLRHLIEQSSFYVLGLEEARTSGWSSMDRRRTPPPITSVGTLSKQKAPVGNDVTASKDPVVSCLLLMDFKKCAS